MWEFAFFLNSILLGVGLAMDAFTVSLANGLNDPKMSTRNMIVVAGVFAAFQFVMPLIGWVCVHSIVQYFQAFSVCIPWIALILLAFIGGKMVIEGIRGDQSSESQEEVVARLSLTTLLMQGIATSIDALSVGFTIADYNVFMALGATVIIGLVTFVICFAGLALGKKFGTKLAGKAQILGGAILIGIGLEIFIQGVL